jgi:Origin recognition complex (ORC) subunit 5 C-terminus
MLVQSLYGGCRDLKEIVRLGRSLWPLYVLPLHSSKIEQTMKNVHKMFSLSKDTPATTASAGRHILSFLDKQIMPHMRQKLDQCIYTLRDEGLNSGENGHCVVNGEGLQSLPYLTKCLMLAAFICQTNKADKDKQLFTMQKNGKKNNGNKRKSPGEDIAFGAAKNGMAKLYRPRPFPMERMLSVFVSIVGLNQGQTKPSTGTPSGTNSVDPSATGSSDFLESLSYLRDVGILQEASNLASPRFWCSLTKEEAEAVSESVNFQLESYLF